MDDVVLTETHDRVALVTLNRPQVRNALSRALLDKLWDVMAALDVDLAVDVVVLTGTDPAFSAGVDLTELSTPKAVTDRDGQEDVAPEATSRAFPEMSKPVIGAINGVAVTGGLELALHCDFLVASERASFGDTHCRVGVQPGMGMTVLLPEAVGVRRARQMSFTGNFVTAAVALQWGLVNQVVGHEELLATALRLGSDISGNDARAISRMRRTYSEIHVDPSALQLEAEVSAAWRREMFDPAVVGERREDITTRGRSQQHRQ